MVCALCGEGPRADDPWVADHRVPRSAGGTDDVSNLQPARRSLQWQEGLTNARLDSGLAVDVLLTLTLPLRRDRVVAKRQIPAQGATPRGALAPAFRAAPALTT